MWLRAPAVSKAPDPFCIPVVLLPHSQADLDDPAVELDLAVALDPSTAHVAPTPRTARRYTPERTTRAIFVPLCTSTWSSSADAFGTTSRTVQYSRLQLLRRRLPPHDTGTKTGEAVAGPRRQAVHSNVRIAHVPHSGPTCKADCLNWNLPANAG